MANRIVKVAHPIWTKIPPCPNLGDRQIHIWRGFYGDYTNIIGQLLDYLDEEEKGRAGRYVRSLDREKYIVYHGLLRCLLSYYTGQKAQEITFEYNRFGKPYLKNDHLDAGIRFNMSDSADMNLIAVGKGITIGVDIEAIRKLQNRYSLARDIFVEEEMTFLEGEDTNEFYRRFFICWTRKEAFMKAVGKGLKIPLKEFSTIPDYHLVKPDAVGPDNNLYDWAIRSFQPATGFYGALATNGGVIKIDFYELSGLNIEG